MEAAAVAAPDLPSGLSDTRPLFTIYHSPAMRYVVLLSGVDTDPARTLFEALRHAGVCVVVVAPGGASEEEEAARARAGWGEEPLAVLFDLAADSALADLHQRAERASTVWPGVPLVACRREAPPGSGRGTGAAGE